jgi:hypothetical protein
MTDETPLMEPVVVALEDMIGRTFLKDEVNGERHRIRIVDLIDKHDNEVMSNPERVKFLCAMDESGREELLSYNQVMDYLHKDLENPTLWRFKRIVSHQGPLKQYDKDYKGSLYIVMIEWEGGEVTMEPLSIIAKDDPVTCAIMPEITNFSISMDGRGSNL